MVKKFNTHTTVKILFDHSAVMFDCIEQMDEQKEIFIRESQFISRLKRHLKITPQEQQQRLRIAFKTDHLFQCQIIADVSSVGGDRHLIFQDEVISLFRLCKASLHQELTDSRLRSHLESLRSVKQRLDDLAVFDEQDFNHTEIKDDLLKQLSDIYGLLRKNIFSMEKMNQKLEDMTAQASRQQGDFSDYRQQMFEHISHIYERRIKPTLSFLNETIRLNDGANLFSIIDDCITIMDNRGQADTAHQISLFSMSLTNIVKPINRLSDEAERFLKKTRQGILESNAMEAAYQTLLNSHLQTQTENMARKYMEKGWAKQTKFAMGLKQQNRPRTYRLGHSTSYIANFHNEVALRLDDLKLFKLTLPAQGQATKQNSSKQRMERADTIYRLLSKMRFRDTNDFTVMMHCRIEPHFDDYQFTDLLTAIFHLSHQYKKDNAGFKLVTTNKRQQIQYRDEAYIYRIKRLELMGSHGE
ncbi:MAG: hypothetical protein HFP77_10195 [Methylococcales symbiont of Iophon sp. n. MRB-2018]|nr:MAG: hypothetical protein HFP77_10195 [Methylococcales symbiont of Iophon sp. n. MRB-2018]KAF3979911.1 MAG: hypothetical protein HFP76_04920 [Methylococcales symbiont of Iophon sp. n. MRB-2018]